MSEKEAKPFLKAKDAAEYYDVPEDALRVIAPAVITEADSDNLMVECRIDSIQIMDTATDEGKMMAIFSIFKKLLKDNISVEHIGKAGVKGYFYIEMPKKLLRQEVIEGAEHGHGMYYLVSDKESQITEHGGIVKTVDILGRGDKDADE